MINHLPVIRAGQFTYIQSEHSE